MELQTEPERYFQLVQDMKQAILSTTNGYLKTGDILERLFTSKLWKFSGFSTWEDFIVAETGMSVSLADHMRRVTRTFGVTLDRQVNFTRLLEMIPIVNDDNMEVLLEKAEREDSRTWKNTVGIEKGKPDMDDCPHTEQRKMSQCMKCLKWFKD